MGIDASNVTEQNLAGDRQTRRQHDACRKRSTRDVIGQTTAMPVFSVKVLGDTTRAGRRPACSLPLVGSKSAQIRPPVSGT